MQWAADSMDVQLSFDEHTKICMAKSTRAIKGGDMLVLLKGQEGKKPEPLVPLSEQPVRRQAKKAKLG